MTSRPRQGCGSQRHNVGLGAVVVLLALGPACGDALPVESSGDPNDPRLFQQTIYITDSATDLALNGPGFLPVRTGPAVRYVRGGRFSFGDDGNLADDRGHVLQVAAPHATSFDVISDVSRSGSWASCESTKHLAFEGNLSDEPLTVPAFDESQPFNSSNFSTFVPLTGPDRQQRQVGVFFRYAGNGVWNWFAVHNNADRKPEIAASGIFRFVAGYMIEGQTALAALMFGDVFQVIEIHFGPTTGARFRSKGMTMLSDAMTITSIQADGGCVVDDVKVSPSGLLSAHDISRLRKDIGRIPVVTFDHPEGLYEVEPGLYATTLASGPAHFGVAGAKAVAV